MKKFIIVISLFIYLAYEAIGQENNSNTKQNSQIYLETDPTTYFFGGYSFAVRRSSTFIDNLNIGIGIYKANLPDEYIESFEENVGKGWKAKSIGADMYFDYHLFNPNKGFTVGASFSVYNYMISRNNKEDKISSFIPTLRVGYLWRPLSKKLNGLYIYPWAGISTDVAFAGNNEIDGETFELSQWPDLGFVPSIQIGYSF